MIEPLPGFDWSKVKWGGPREPIADYCGYCGEPITEASVPLRLWTEQGAATAFCDACMERWWGFRL